jgi:N-acetylglutamate synthase-like GNAT family acetyltransferase
VTPVAGQGILFLARNTAAKKSKGINSAFVLTREIEMFARITFVAVFAVALITVLTTGDLQSNVIAGDGFGWDAFKP